MAHIHYDLGLVVGSVVVALIVCYFAFSIEQLLFQKKGRQYQKLIILVSGAILGAAIWSMHFVGMLATALPAEYHFDRAFTIASYIIAFAASTFTVWLTSRSTLPLARLVLGAVLMGFAISGMHYTGMMGLLVEGYTVFYDPLLTIFSVLIAISGSGLTFWLFFKYKNNQKYAVISKFIVSSMMTLSIVGMHYTGMAAAEFRLTGTESLLDVMQTGPGLILFTVIFVTSLILVAAFSVAVLEQRLEERNRQLSRANKELANQAVQDNLTKLPNRLYLTEYTHVLFTDQRYHQEKIAFLYIDLDRFKAVNDVFGHHVGDQLLIQLANRMHKILDERSKLLRIGGDEFLMVVENANINRVIDLCNKILATIQESYLIAGKEINISGSIGAAIYPEHGNNLQDILIHADAAMLTSKQQGRNTYSIFNFTEDQREQQSQSKLINDLYKAVEVQQFVLYYQPKFFTKDYQVCGVEALIRWNHPTLGLLAPGMFIKGAEKTGLITQMGYWALEEACRQIQIWENNNQPYFPVAVNLSAVQFEHKHLFEQLEKMFKKYQINPNHLMIEITESTAMHHIESSLRTFERLRQMGIKLAIDDFGTGHSSFLYLKNLAVDELKIDREFIRNLTEGSKDEIILESIVKLAIKLGLIITAEGVETPLQAEILKRLGCTQLQGFLLGHPMPPNELEEKVRFDRVQPYDVS